MRWIYYLLAVLLLLAAACSSANDEPNGDSGRTPVPSPTTTPRDSVDLGDLTSDPTTEPTASPVAFDKSLYIALGDSLSYGSAASDPDTTSFVALVHAAFGSGVGLLNLGVPGYTSTDLLIEGELDQAVGEIRSRLLDEIESNEAVAVTLEIGGNDLLGIYTDLVIPGTCASVTESLEKDECVNGLSEVLAGFEASLDATLASLRSVDDDLPIFLMTLYNPFSGTDSPAERIGDLALEGEPASQFEAGLNDIVRDIGARYGATLVEIFPLFEDKSSEYVAFDLIHPNDRGYAVIADAILTEMLGAGLPIEFD